MGRACEMRGVVMLGVGLTMALMAPASAQTAAEKDSSPNNVLDTSVIYSMACFQAASHNLGAMSERDAAALTGLGFTRENTAAWTYSGADGQIVVGVLGSRTTVTFTPTRKVTLAEGILVGLAQRAKHVTMGSADILSYEMEVAPEGIRAPKVRDEVSVGLDGEWINSSRWVVWGPLGSAEGHKP